ncbi:unnamed protein product [Lepidochelys olivacea]
MVNLQGKTQTHPCFRARQIRITGSNGNPCRPEVVLTAAGPPQKAGMGHSESDVDERAGSATQPALHKLQRTKQQQHSPQLALDNLRGGEGEPVSVQIPTMPHCRPFITEHNAEPLREGLTPHLGNPTSSGDTKAKHRAWVQCQEWAQVLVMSPTPYSTLSPSGAEDVVCASGPREHPFPGTTQSK